MQGDNHPAKRALAEAQERTIAKLAECFARDELSLETFEQRVSDAYACSTDSELQALVRDLSGNPSQASVTALARYTPPLGESLALARVSERPAMTAILGSVERGGTLRVGERTRALAVLGSLVIDLRETPLPPGLTELHVRAVLGSVEIVVPADLAVDPAPLGPRPHAHFRAEGHSPTCRSRRDRRDGLRTSCRRDTAGRRDTAKRSSCRGPEGAQRRRRGTRRAARQRGSDSVHPGDNTQRKPPRSCTLPGSRSPCNIRS